MTADPVALVREIVTALPTTDPVGAIVAAIHRHDQTTNRLVTMAAVARGVPEDVVRVEVGLVGEGT